MPGADTIAGALPCEARPGGKLWEECRDVLRELVQMDTCQPLGNEATIADTICGMLPDYVTVRRLEHGSGRPSLVACVEGRSPSGGMAFAGHMDTVSCGSHDDWSYPPHEAHIEGDVLYGRGAADMKGGDAALLVALQRLTADGFVPERTITVCFTADEEADGIGAKAVAADGSLDGARGIVICEPTSRRIGVCEKGALWLSIDAEGTSSHASHPELGANAVEACVVLAMRLHGIAGEVTPDSLLGKPTVAITEITGGTATNIVPARAHMTADIRTVPGMAHDALIQAVCEAAYAVEGEIPGVKFRVSVTNDRPAVGTACDNPFVQFCSRAVERQGLSSVPCGIYCYTDASQFIPATGAPFVIMGPGDIEQMHCVDEHVSISEVARYALLYEDLMRQS